ncbi:hypothetical protein V6N13_085968 [Hibiscus sabdariffa]
MENGEIPENANEHCPGPQSESAGKSDACQGCPNQEVCATAPKGPDPDLVAIAERMATVKHKILVLSGKGGVGKSTFSAQLSFALAAKDFQVGLLDIDICGPSIPKMLGLEGQDIHQSNLGWSPVYVESNLGVMSIGFMLPNPDEAVIWRGPRKNGLIKQFLKDVYWGELDFLVVDAPPGTSDEHISIVQFLQATGIDGAIIVTTPQQVSLIDVRKEVSFCKKVGVPILGVVENMSGLCQPLKDFRFLKMTENGEHTDLTEKVIEFMREKAPEMLDLIAASEVFDSSGGGAAKMCTEMGVPFLGKVPLDPQLCKAAEEGKSCFAEQKCRTSAPALKNIVEKLMMNYWHEEMSQVNQLKAELEQTTDHGGGDPLTITTTDAAPACEVLLGYDEDLRRGCFLFFVQVKTSEISSSSPFHCSFLEIDQNFKLQEKSTMEQFISGGEDCPCYNGIVVPVKSWRLQKDLHLWDCSNGYVHFKQWKNHELKTYHLPHGNKLGGRCKRA